ncbi:hypothetical protein CPB84DRAFT_1854538 [Gymnopilus junonius]|uniref:Uncharacterized protein n=1 Tax=Gymnopilus junonius TaxID=109634 RepID=A0A9P5TG69_GYMJU|nr:hypothetical protein CPB84DRAFT_1854538 [Gymnopilus junonius]
MSSLSALFTTRLSQKDRGLDGTGGTLRRGRPIRYIRGRAHVDCEHSFLLVPQMHIRLPHLPCCKSKLEDTPPNDCCPHTHHLLALKSKLEDTPPMTTALMPTTSSHSRASWRTPPPTTAALIPTTSCTQERAGGHPPNDHCPCTHHLLALKSEPEDTPPTTATLIPTTSSHSRVSWRTPPRQPPPSYPPPPRLNMSWRWSWHC